MKTSILSIILLSLPFIIQAQKIEHDFVVKFNDKEIGTLHAVEMINGSTVIKDIRSETDASVFMMSIHVESEIKSKYENSILIKAISYRDSNRDKNDVHCVVQQKEQGYDVERNGENYHIKKDNIDWTISDLHFKEPKGVTKVFSNMWGEYLEIKAVGNGRYDITRPDGKESFYIYEDGELVAIEIETPVGKVNTDRIK